MKKILVTGASGFLGKEIAAELLRQNYHVRAAYYRNSPGSDKKSGLEIVHLDLQDRDSVLAAVKGVDAVCHCGAIVDSGVTRQMLNEINKTGSEVLWECMAAEGIQKGLYCSSAAVYGLLCSGREVIDEKVEARAIEPYGRSKLEGEKAVITISKKAGMKTVIIRPVAIFGPGEHTPFGKALREAAVSKILIAGGFTHKSFSFVQVRDVARAAVFLLQKDIPDGEIFNICADNPIRFEDAFSAYIRVLGRRGRDYFKVKMLAIISLMIQKVPHKLMRALEKMPRDYLFGIWHHGFDLIYSSGKIRALGFRFSQTDFEEVFMTCLEKS